MSAGTDRQQDFFEKIQHCCVKMLNQIFFVEDIPNRHMKFMQKIYPLKA